MVLHGNSRSGDMHAPAAYQQQKSGVLSAGAAYQQPKRAAMVVQWRPFNVPAAAVLLTGQCAYVCKAYVLSAAAPRLFRQGLGHK
jgi:hypothetical protein